MLSVFDSTIPHLTLYSRTYCHLCDDMLAALELFKNEYSFIVEVVDVDADQALVERFDELVPVLVGKRGNEATQLCHYFLNEAAVRTFLAAD